MISVDEARALIAQAFDPLAAERVSLDGAAGRVLAQPAIAQMTQPPFDASAMDGYAVRAADASEGARLSVIGTSAAGERFAGAVSGGEAVRIFTGAPVPDGADAVIVQENIERAGETITVSAGVAQGANIRPAGNDFTNGDELLAAGVALTPPALALAAAASLTHLSVRRRPRIALIANGDELVMPGEERGPDAIICSAPFALAPMIEAWGGAPEFLGIAPDDPAALRAFVERAAGFDLIVPIGGASVGDRDHMRPVFSETGFEMVFEKVAVRPGKPTWFARAGARAAIGLPGNPASAMATAILFVRPAIDAMLGVPASTRLNRGRLSESVSANGPRETYLRGRVEIDSDGEARLTPNARQDSSLHSVFAASNALIRRAANAPALDRGGAVEYLDI
ncbi:MAG: gephyrin-like molybdotransferase Glp [Pseudomonadota bacterium]